MQPLPRLLGGARDKRHHPQVPATQLRFRHCGLVGRLRDPVHPRPWFPPGFPYLTFFPAVVLVAYYAGLRPAVLTAVLSGLTAWWLWIGPRGLDFGVATLVALGFYVFVVAVDIFFIVGMDRATRDLAKEVERNADLARSRDLLLKEAQHRVSNNIQVVSALLKLEARESDEPARKVLLQASARTALIARVQRSLADVDGRSTSFASMARTIIDDALSAADRREVEVAIIGEGAILSSEEATPVTFIMLEAVNSSLEHAFPDGPGRIEIRFEDQGERRVLTVTDDGRGLPPAFDVAGATSLGLRIVLGMSAQLKGDWTMKSATRGTVARLEYPKPNGSN